MHNTVSVQTVSWLKAFEVIVIYLFQKFKTRGGSRKVREVNGNED